MWNKSSSLIMVIIQLFQVNSERLMCIYPPLTRVPGPPSPGVVALLVLAVAEPLVSAIAALALSLHRCLRPVKSGVSVCWLCKAVVVQFEAFDLSSCSSYQLSSYQAITCLCVKLSFFRIVLWVSLFLSSYSWCRETSSNPNLQTM